ncbi:RodZ domain-containing protein [uncultured Pseudoalteromonas sp.]|uniref:RodZ domain-containing protein n=1 Tax=uncultured Pseudoalteromonas sp. TaxID=114053 RepID=UPI0030C85092
MTEETTQQSDEPSAGQLLKAHREQANISLESLTGPLKLSISQLQRLESDEYQTLGPITFVKGYIKNYCRELNIDSAPILAKLPAPPEPTKPANMQSFSRRTEKEAHDSRLMLVSYIILAIVIGSSAMWFWQNATPIDEQTSSINIENSILDNQQNNNTLNNESQSSAQLPATQAADNTLTETPTRVEQMPLSEAVNATAPIAANTQAAANEPDTQSNTSTITMVFNDESWVEIHDGEGERIAFGVKKAGYNMTVSGTPPFSVVLGKHDVVSVSLNGEPVDISGFPKNRLAKFKLPLAE